MLKHTGMFSNKTWAELSEEVDKIDETLSTSSNNDNNTVNEEKKEKNENKKNTSNPTSVRNQLTYSQCELLDKLALSTSSRVVVGDIDRNTLAELVARNLVDETTFSLTELGTSQAKTFGDDWTTVNRRTRHTRRHDGHRHSEQSPRKKIIDHRIKTARAELYHARKTYLVNLMTSSGWTGSDNATDLDTIVIAFRDDQDDSTMSHKYVHSLLFAVRNNTNVVDSVRKDEKVMWYVCTK